jgi:O-antigen/teichoic acid export membrane protein
VRRLVGAREISNVFWLAVGDGSGKVGFFIANLYLARTLRPAQYGIFVLAQSLVFYAWQATDLGSTMYGIREVARNRDEAAQTTASLLGLRLTAGVIGSAVCLIILLVWPLPHITRIIFAGAGLYLALRPLYLDFTMKGLEQFRTLAIGSIAAGAVFLGFCAAFVHGPSGAPLAAFLWSASWLAGSVVLGAYLRWGAKVRLSVSFRLKSWAVHIRHSVHFALAGGLLLVYDTLPIILVGIVYGSTKLGMFSAVYRLIISLTGASYLIPMALYPTLSDWHANDVGKFRQLHRRLRNLMMAGGLAAAALGVVFAGPAVALLLGDAYRAAVPLFRILSVDLFCYAARFTYGTGLAAAGHQKLYTLVSLLGLAVLGATFLPAASRFGLPGAAASVVLADGAVGTALAYILRRKIADDRPHAPAQQPAEVTS